MRLIAILMALALCGATTPATSAERPDRVEADLILVGHVVAEEEIDDIVSDTFGKRSYYTFEPLDQSNARLGFVTATAQCLPDTSKPDQLYLMFLRKTFIITAQFSNRDGHSSYGFNGYYAFACMPIDKAAADALKVKKRKFI